MKRKLLKTFLLAVGLLAGASNVWADDVTFGQENKKCGTGTGAWDASSKTSDYNLPKGGFITFNFTNYTNTSTDDFPDTGTEKWEVWFNWLLVIKHNNSSILAYRCDNWGWETNWAAGTKTTSDGFEITRDKMDGCDVVLRIDRSNENQFTVRATMSKNKETWWEQIVFTNTDTGDDDVTMYLTAENCKGLLHSVVSDKYVGLSDNNTTWWNNFSEYYTIEKDKTLTLSFTNYTRGTENYDSWILGFTTDADRQADEYTEYLMYRADNWGWGTTYSSGTLNNNYNWDSFKTDMAGANVVLKIRRNGTKVTVKATLTTTSGKTYYEQITIPACGTADETMRAFLLADHAHLTNITYSVTDTPDGAKEYLYTIKAVDGRDKDLKTFATGSYWTGESAITLAIPQYILSGTTLLGVAKQSDDYWYRVSVTPNAANYVHKITYDNESISNVVYFSEAEDISGFSGSTSDATTSRASGGKCARSGGSFKNLTTLGAGKYKVYIRGIADNDDRKASIKAGDETIINDWVIGNGIDQNKNAEFTISSPTAITAACSATSATGLDWVYIQTIGEAATIGATGWTTFASPYALDLSKMTASTGTVSAYYASAVGDGKVIMTSTEQAAVAAGEGIMLKGTVGATITIPVVASGETITGNMLVGCPNGETLTTNDNYYVLVSNGGTPEFQRLATNGATIPTGKAYLNAGDAARSLQIVFDETTGIEAMHNAQCTMHNEMYDLQGRRVAQPKKGLYIKNGQKVYIK